MPLGRVALRRLTEKDGYRGMIAPGRMRLQEIPLCTYLTVCVVFAVAALALILHAGCVRRPEQPLPQAPVAPLPPDRRIAGKFLGVDPLELRPTRPSPRVDELRGGDFRSSSWTWTGEARDGAKAPTAHVKVDLDLYYVAGAHWEDDTAHWGEPAREGARLLTRDRAYTAALAYIKARCWFIGEARTPSSEGYKDYLPQPLYVFTFEGSGPEEYEYRVEVSVSAVTGEVVVYEAEIVPAAPAAVAPVVLSEAEAVSRVREAVPRLWPNMEGPIEVEVYKLWTRSPYAPPGRPVYMTDVSGRAAHPGKPPSYSYYGVVCGVDAQTGEVLTELIAPLTGAVGGSEITVTAAQAAEKARAALPAALATAGVEIGEMTSRSRLAPLGTRVYPAAIRGTLAAPTTDEPWDWAQTWAVDAVTGAIYGLHVAGTEQPEVTPLWPDWTAVRP